MQTAPHPSAEKDEMNPPVLDRTELLLELATNTRRLDQRLRALLPLLVELRDLIRVVVWLALLGYGGCVIWFILWLTIR